MMRRAAPLLNATLDGLVGPRSSTVEELLRYNESWAADVTKTDPEFFATLAKQQHPHFLWIGCSDSRVPANQIVGLPPGEVFVHRNIANVVVPTDLNLLSVLQFAVDVLKVRHVIVCGHYGCGGVNAALNNMRLGLVDQWIRHVRDVHDKHIEALHRCPEGGRLDALCEANVVEQVRHVAQTTVFRDAWKNGRGVHLHGLAYGLNNGRLQRLLEIKKDDEAHVEEICNKAALDLLAKRALPPQ